MDLKQLALDEIDPPAHDHRTEHDAARLQELADSIREQGLLNPIQVISRGARYEIAAGHRRYLAHRILRRATIAAFVLEGRGNRAAQVARFAENFHRDNLSPIEEARAMREAINTNALTTAHLARVMRRSPAWIADRLALLELPDDVQGALHARAISTGAALALAEVDDERHRAYLLEHAARNGASIAVVRAWVAEYLQQKAAAGAQPLPAPDPAQPPIAARILMPCALCTVEHDHTALVIVRICRPCLSAIHAPATSAPGGGDA